MHLVFLGARLPLTKTFLQTSGVMRATPYPLVSKVTSYHEECNDLQGFADLIRIHAKQGHCLFGGRLQRPLHSESRAGLTAHDPKQWVVFDFDKVVAADHREVVTKLLPPECQGVSYLVQMSASMYRPDITTWSGHIYMLLSAPVTEKRLKEWMEWINFNVPALAAQISLSESLQALHWPLDRTAVYSSKLIYIAPPKCFGFQPKIKEPLLLVKGKKAAVTIPDFNPIDSITIRQKINELRRAVGEDDIEYSVTPFEGHEILRNSKLCEVHGIKTSGDHYIRFNLNGGDSYAYYIDLRSPQLIRNFKGEPFLKTEEAAPELWKVLRAKAPQIVSKTPLDEGTEVLAFYATNHGSQIKVGTYAPIEEKVTLHNATETSAKAWLAEYGIVQKGYLPHMDLVFEPTNDVQYIAGNTVLNTFKATKYMKRERTNPETTSIVDLKRVPTINKVISSMLGDPNAEMLDQFLNWLAYIYQTRSRAETAWVIWGRTGTGKSSFVRYILAPLFGPEHVSVVQFGLLAGQFNGFLENKLFVVFEEADSKAVENSAELLAKLNHYITDSPVEIRKMRTDSYSAENYCNFLFFSNQRTPAIITADDRRFNVAERQERQIHFTPNEMVALNDCLELDDFADILQRYPVDIGRVRKPLESRAKSDIHEASTSINQLIAEAILAGDLQFFIDRTPTAAEAQADFFNRFNPLGMFTAAIDRFAKSAENNEQVVLSDEDLFVLFRTLITDSKFFQDSKTWRRRHFKSLGLDIERQVRIGRERKRGVPVQWKKPEHYAPAKPDDASTNVTPIKGKKKA